jgi:hypothetical protein
MTQDQGTSVATVTVPFNILRPFRTSVGWPARLVGVLQRRSNPFVVAVWNPNWKSEELHVYPASGKHAATIEPHPLDLVRISDEDYWRWVAPAKGMAPTPVHAFIVKVENWPVNANPMRLDTMSMCTDLVRGWSLLHEGFDHKEEPRPLRDLKLYNDRTGEVFVLHFTPMDQQELETKNG